MRDARDDRKDADGAAPLTRRERRARERRIGTRGAGAAPNRAGGGDAVDGQTIGVEVDHGRAEGSTTRRGDADPGEVQRGEAAASAQAERLERVETAPVPAARAATEAEMLMPGLVEPRAIADACDGSPRVPGGGARRSTLIDPDDLASTGPEATAVPAALPVAVDAARPLPVDAAAAPSRHEGGELAPPRPALEHIVEPGSDAVYGPRPTRTTRAAVPASLAGRRRRRTAWRSLAAGVAALGIAGSGGLLTFDGGALDGVPASTNGATVSPVGPVVPASGTSSEWPSAPVEPAVPGVPVEPAGPAAPGGAGGTDGGAPADSAPAEPVEPGSVPADAVPADSAPDASGTPAPDGTAPATSATTAPASDPAPPSTCAVASSAASGPTASAGSAGNDECPAP